MVILYFVHNVNDPAVKRRVAMFHAGGAEVVVTGFVRGAYRAGITGAKREVILGQTHDARLFQRAWKVMASLVRVPRELRNIGKVDVVVARNLETLAVAGRCIRAFPKATLIYECLDIHRLLISKSITGVLLRAFESLLLRRCQLLLTSSSGFIENYFSARRPPSILLVENRVFGPELTATLSFRKDCDALPNDCDQADGRPLALVDRPIVIGWFGAIRCRRTLELLSQLSGLLQGRLRVVIRGRPAVTEFDDFYGRVKAEPYIDFLGEYCYPDDLAQIYAEVDFVWAMDFFEEGANSEWLLPNRIYEGGLHCAIPIYRQATQIAIFCQTMSIGVPFSENQLQEFAEWLSELTDEQYQQLRRQVTSINRGRWLYDEKDCQQLVNAMSSPRKCYERNGIKAQREHCQVSLLGAAHEV